MTFRPLLAASLLFAAVSGHTQSNVFTLPTKQITAKVSIMAISSSVHQAFAGNQDTYLADATLKDGHQTVRLVDLYSGSGSPIRRSILADRHQLVMHLVRTPGCDVASGHFFLEPSDRNVFDAGSRAALSASPDAVIPCYMVVHDKTRLAKN